MYTEGINKERSSHFSHRFLHNLSCCSLVAVSENAGLRHFCTWSHFSDPEVSAWMNDPPHLSVQPHNACHVLTPPSLDQ